ncbi:MAG: ABC transporter ATP-binding protein [Myxococcota bacterium]|nr:ABC transporter ATP-binding protein [Myxococcota bacterium]
MTAAVHAEHLSKHFASFTAVHDVSLHVDAGSIFGFIGPNGAGKTTTIRMLLGLIAPSGGSATLFGHDIRHDFKAAISNVGAFVEGPAFYPFLSGRQNLRIFAGISGGVPAGRIDDVLEQVGLRKRSEDRVKAYSQGMKQRLGIALAMLEAPRLLILDEPTNGLDPQGTREMRELVRRVRDEHGTTVLLSSHLLGEMEQICDQVAVISSGRILRKGSLDEVIGHEGERVELTVDSDDVAKASQLLLERFATESSSPRLGRLEFLRGSLELAEVIRALVEAGVRVSEFTPRRRNLEQAFVELTGERSALRGENGK